MTPLSPGQGQSLLALLSGMGGQSVGGLAGLIELARTQDASKAAARVGETADALSYTPTDPLATAMLQALEPVAGAVEKGETWIGENTADASGSPLLGALAKAAPGLLAFLRPVKAARAIKGAVAPPAPRDAFDALMRLEYEAGKRGNTTLPPRGDNAIFTYMLQQMQQSSR